MTVTPSPDNSAAQPRRRILAVLDESELGRRTTAIAVGVAARLNCNVSFLVAIPIEHIEARSPASMTHALAAYRQLCHDRTQPLFEQAIGQARTAGIDGRTVLTIEEDPCSAVLRIAGEQACDLIVVGSHGRGTVARVLHGSLVADLVRLSPRPVLVCRDDMHLGAADTCPPTAV